MGGGGGGGVQKVSLHEEGKGEGIQITHKNYIICTAVLKGHPYKVFENISLTKAVQPTKQFGVAGLYR